MINRIPWVLLLLVVGLMMPGTAQPQADPPVRLRILWFDDARESVILQELVNEFNAENPGVEVEIELTIASEHHRLIEEGLRSGRVPHLVRTNEPTRHSEDLLDLRPYLEDPDAWAANFSPTFLASLRKSTDDDALYGFPTEVTLSAPFINRDLWEEAGVPIPSDDTDEVTWDEWIIAAGQVQGALQSNDREVYALAMDRSGHRFWGPSLSLCATYVDINDPFSDVTIDTPGFRDAAQRLKNWHDWGLTPLTVWMGTSDTTIPASEFFIDGKVAFYFSGSWQIGAFERQISEFDWEVVPNPVGPCGQTGMVGGNTMVAMQGPGDEAWVGRLVDFLTRDENLERFYIENLLLPGHQGMIESGLTYTSSQEELETFRMALDNAAEEAYALQYRPDSSTIHGAIRRGLTDMLTENLSIDETVARVQSYLPSPPPQGSNSTLPPAAAGQDNDDDDDDNDDD